MMGTRGRQQTYVLRVDLAPLWLAGIEANRVADNVKDKIIRYKREVAKVLWEAFQEGRLTAEPSLDELLQSDSPAAQAYRMAQAVMTLARQQLVLESRIDDHEDRLETIEAQLAPPSHAVSQSQAMQISQAVKTVAIALGKQTKRNEFGAVYGELYRKFDVTSYKLIPASAFEEVMGWLTEWHQNLTEEML